MAVVTVVFAGIVATGVIVSNAVIVVGCCDCCDCAN